MDAAMFESLDPGLLGALMLVGVPVAAIVLIGLASQFPSHVIVNITKH
jgi:hypothetical protein